MINVAVVGHSQTPTIDSYDDVNIDTFMRGGAIISHAYMHPLNECFNRQYDIVIIFLGGNDIGHRPVQTIGDELIELANAFEGVRHVYVTQIEQRTYPVGHRHFVPYDDYRKQKNAINRRLVNYAKNNKSFRTINCSSPNYTDNSYDGIHFNVVGKESIVHKYINAIEKARREMAE